MQSYAMEQDELLPMVQSKNLTFSFSSESSIEEELKRESTADVITILVRFFFDGVHLIFESCIKNPNLCDK